MTTRLAKLESSLRLAVMCAPYRSLIVAFAPRGRSAEAADRQSLRNENRELGRRYEKENHAKRRDVELTFFSASSSFEQARERVASIRHAVLPAHALADLRRPLRVPWVLQKVPQRRGGPAGCVAIPGNRPSNP